MDSSNVLKILAVFLIGSLAQIFIFNNLQISGFINPYAYIIAIMAMPFGTTTPVMIAVSFAQGLAIDIFCNTPGMHAGACVMIGYLRQYILKLIAQRDAYKSDMMPSASSYGIAWFLKYSVMMVSVHHVMLFFIEQFDTLFFWPTLCRVLLSILATILFILAAQFFLPSGGRTSDF